MIRVGQGFDIHRHTDDADRRNGRPLQGRQQHPAKGVPDGVPVTPLEGLRHKLGVGLRGGVFILDQATRNLEPVQLDRTTGLFLLFSRCDRSFFF